MDRVFEEKEGEDNIFMVVCWMEFFGFCVGSGVKLEIF